MNNIDKYIKLNFSFIKGEMIGLFCCTVLASVGIFMPSVAFFVLILLVAMIVLIVRVYTIIYSKTLFDEGAVLYQSLPFSTDEIVVAKTFVVAVATLIAWIGLMGGVAVGLAVMTSSIQEPALMTNLSDLLNEIGAFGAAVVIFQLVAQSFFMASIFFAACVVFKTTKAYADRFLMSVIFVAVMTFQSEYLDDFALLIAGNNLLIQSIIDISIKMILSVGSCLVTKYYLDNKYIMK